MDFEQLIEIIDNVPYFNWHKIYSKQDKLDYLKKTINTKEMKSYLTVKELLAPIQPGDIIYTEITSKENKTKQLVFVLKDIKWEGEENKPGVFSFKTEDGDKHTIEAITVENVVFDCYDTTNFKVEIYRIKL